MSDWQPGDLALCVRAVAPIKAGEVHRVIYAAPDWNTGITALCFEGVEPAHPKADSFLCNRFRKIRPHTPDAEDAETIRLLTGKPVPEPMGQRKFERDERGGVL